MKAKRKRAKRCFYISRAFAIFVEWLYLDLYSYIYMRKFGKYDLHYFDFLARILHLILIMCNTYYILVCFIDSYLVITHFRNGNMSHPKKQQLYVGSIENKL